MADISVQKKEGGDLTWVWAAAAVVAIVALMGWLLSTQDQARTIAGPVPTDTVVEEAEAETVELSAVGAAPDQFVGRTVRVEQVPVASELGPRGFFTMLPDGSPFLVIVDPAVPDANWVRSGTERTVEGTIRPASEADLNSWVAAGQITTQGRSMAVIASHYLLVTEVAAP